MSATQTPAGGASVVASPPVDLSTHDHFLVTCALGLAEERMRDRAYRDRAKGAMETVVRSSFEQAEEYHELRRRLTSARSLAVMSWQTERAEMLARLELERRS